MTETAKRLILASAVVAGVVALAAILDLVIEFPFSGFSMVMDILFLIGAVITLYLCYDSWKDLR